MPDSKSLWKEFCKAMRAVEGHNSRNRPTVDKYWSKEGPLNWPGEPIFVIQAQGTEGPVYSTKLLNR